MTKLTSIFALSALAAGVVFLNGCASSGYKKGNRTAQSIQRAADKIATLSSQVDQTLASLNDLTTNPQADLRPQYRRFASDLRRMESSAEDLTAARMSVGQRGKDFFAQWDEQIAQINNEDIRTRSQSRREEVATRLQTIKASYGEAEQAFRPFIKDLRDVQKFLSVDLTPGGLAAIKDIAANAQAKAVKLQQSLDKLAKDFAALGVSMSTVAPTPPVAR